MKLSSTKSLVILATLAGVIGISWYVIIPQIKIRSVGHLIEKIQNIPGFEGSVVVVDAKYEGAEKDALQINTGTPIHPGSNYKLLTGAASLHYLTPDFTFKTNFYTLTQNGKQHLLIEGRGDPTFHHEDIQAIAATLREKDIKITGNLYYDEEYFNGESYGPDWESEWKDIHFGVPVAALQMDDSILYIRGKGSAVKNNLMIATAALELYPLIKDIRTLVTTPPPHKISAKMGEDGVVTIEGETAGNNDFSTSTNMRNPGQMTAEVFRQELIKNKIISKKSKVLNFAREKENLKNIKRKLVHNHTSAPLQEIVKQMLTFSKNNYGETLIRTLGEEKNKSSGKTGSQAKGVEILEKFLTNEVKIAPEDFKGLDGSGMSPSSRITGRGIMQLFEYVNRQSWKDIYWEALPGSNQEGTLRHRFLETNIQHPIIAKTGTHEFASSLSGKITRENDAILFSVHVFQHQIPSEQVGIQVQHIIDKIVKLLDERL